MYSFFFTYRISKTDNLVSMASRKLSLPMNDIRVNTRAQSRSLTFSAPMQLTLTPNPKNSPARSVRLLWIPREKGRQETHSSTFSQQVPDTQAVALPSWWGRLCPTRKTKVHLARLRGAAGRRRWVVHKPHSWVGPRGPRGLLRGHGGFCWGGPPCREREVAGQVRGLHSALALCGGDTQRHPHFRAVSPASLLH